MKLGVLFRYSVIPVGIGLMACHAGAQGLPSHVWQTVGNRGTNPTTDFLGTTDAVDLNIRTNNVNRLRVLAGGDVFIYQNLSVGLDADIFGSLVVGVDGTFGRNVFVGNNLSVGNDGLFGHNLTVGNDGSFGHNLGVGNDGTFGNNLGVGNNLTVGGLGNFTNTTNATSPTTGALVVAGGAGIAKDFYVGGNTHLSTLNVDGTTDSTSPSTGALVVAGGAGIGKRLNVGGAAAFSTNVSVGGNLTVGPGTMSVTSSSGGSFQLDSNSHLFLESKASGDASNTGHFAMDLKGQDQGLIIRLNNASTPDSSNHFVDFWDNGNHRVGRIEGQTAAEFAADGEQIAIDVLDGFNLGEIIALAIFSEDPGAASDILSLGAVDTFDAAVRVIKLANIGVAYASGSGDYAEYLRRNDRAEKMAAGDIVGVSGGRISKKTEGAEQLMVISAAPAVLGNMPSKEDEHLFEKVAFLGQVKVKVVGPVSQGDYIIPSGQNDGTALAVSPSMMTADEFGHVIGRAWESSSSESLKSVKVAVGLNGGDVANLVKKHQEQLIALEAASKKHDQDTAELRDELAATKAELAELRQLILNAKQQDSTHKQP